MQEQNKQQVQGLGLHTLELGQVLELHTRELVQELVLRKLVQVLQQLLLLLPSQHYREHEKLVH